MTGRHSPIAIVGAACRLPGAPDVSGLWELLVHERDTVTEIPSDRLMAPDWADLAQRRRLVASRAGGFLPGIDLFDAAFFGISPNEAVRLDPQHRLMLECTWEALEDAGIPAERLAGSSTGVYTACLFSDYWDLLRAGGKYDAHASLGGASCGIAAGRISYQLDLRGPSMGLAATCSSSLLAVHLAVQALRSGEIEAAIVAGASLLVGPDLYFPLTSGGLLSRSGRCRFGDAGADGYVRSEGGVALVLKPLDRALADGDPVYAAILGSAVNNDGRSGGTMIGPGLDGQEAMLRAAYRDAGVSPGEVRYVETHGAGTPNGDRVELTALGRVLREGREPGRRCLAGSVKSNIGHIEGAAGMAGLLKAALAVRHRTIPRTLHVETPIPVVQDPGQPVDLALRTVHEPPETGRFVAGVSSFGLSGTNAHVVLADVPVPATARRRRRHRFPYLLPLSARDPRALAELAGRYADLVGERPSAERVADVAYSAAVRRSHHRRRAAVVAGDPDTLLEALRSLRDGTPHPAVVGGTAPAAKPPRVVFVFPGQGSQWVGMGRELLARGGVFARRFRECDRAIRAELGWSPVERLDDDRPLTAVDEVQPMLWAVQVSLASLWQHWGIRPDLVIGHSMGEIAAATATGALTVADGAAVVCRRSRLLRELPEPGAMCAVQLGEQEARRAIGDAADRVCVGVVNSSDSCVLSGDPAELAKIVEPLRRRGVYCRMVQVDYASHAPQVEAVREGLLDALAGLRPRNGRTPVHSTVMDRPAAGTEFDAAYWMENLRRQVRFASAVRTTLTGDDPALFIEISPHPTLLAAIESEIAAQGADAWAVPSLRRDEPETESLLLSLGAVYARGCSPGWRRVQAEGRSVPLPSYPWQRRRYWVDAPKPSRAAENADQARPTDPDPIGDEWAGSLDMAATVMELAVDLGPDAGAPGGGARPLRSAAACRRRLTAVVAGHLGMAPQDLEPEAPLVLAGLDSLAAVRLRHLIEREFELSVPVGELLGPRPLAELADDLYARLTELPRPQVALR
ncbi:type I polyketide synthase [Allonocardiopsis opalescens]|uniref:Acyl transferase domain-containing protein n=1 Tax=Allonocardiopsis opalescens TaxID=1144618 RepID=A0A2T0PZX0_9ACTN|nr:type I polyketide synthase [Allonocardiopsis opalescens]PRX97101.1 acyl transferase domain-containing protein [Allonocardiopsis opalescens]